MKNQKGQSLLNSKECLCRIWPRNCWLSQHLTTKKPQKKRNCNQKLQALQIKTRLLFRMMNHVQIVKARVKKQTLNQTCSVLKKKKQVKRRQMSRKQMLNRLENRLCFICHKSKQKKMLGKIQKRNMKKKRIKMNEKFIKVVNLMLKVSIIIIVYIFSFGSVKKRWQSVVD